MRSTHCGRSIRTIHSWAMVRVLDEPKREDDEDDEPPDSMALAIASASARNRARQEDPFALYVVDSEGPPLVHVSRTRRSEIVIFGRQQKLLPPIVLDTGCDLAQRRRATTKKSS